MEGYCRDMRGRIRLARDDTIGALVDAARGTRQARGSDQPQLLYPALAFQTRALVMTDAPREAEQAADELLVSWSSQPAPFPASSWVVDLVFGSSGSIG